MAGSIAFSSSGSFMDATKFLHLMSKGTIQDSLNKYGQLGTHVLKGATPVDSAATAQGWYHKVEKKDGKWVLSWHNQNRTTSGQSVAILIQYGHGTGTGGYVAGQDFINPAIKPVFDLIVAEVRRKVTR